MAMISPLHAAARQYLKKWNIFLGRLENYIPTAHIGFLGGQPNVTTLVTKVMVVTTLRPLYEGRYDPLTITTPPITRGRNAKLFQKWKIMLY